jgi:hypothetical protein
MTIASASPLVCDGRRGGAICTFRSFRSSASATKRGVEVPSSENGHRRTNGSARKVRREIDVLRDNLLLPNIDEAGRDADAKDVRRSPSAWVQYYGTCAMKCQSPLPNVSVKAERDKLNVVHCAIRVVVTARRRKVLRCAALLTRGANSVTLLRMSVEKQCGKCGASFLCQTAELCWCASYKLDERQLTTIGQQYSNCLCEACLAALSSRDREQKHM